MTSTDYTDIVSRWFEVQQGPNISILSEWPNFDNRPSPPLHALVLPWRAMGFLDLTKIDRFISSEGSYPGESYLLMEQHVEMSPNNNNNNDVSEVKSSIVANPEATSRHSNQSVTLNSFSTLNLLPG